MLIRVVATFVAIVIGIPVQAATVFNVQSITCPSFEQYELSGPMAISCVGDLSITGGEIKDDHAIKLSATGSLALLDLVLAAPQIEILSGNGLIFGDADLLTNLKNSGEGIIGSGSTLSVGGFIDFRPGAGKGLVSLPGSNILVSLPGSNINVGEITPVTPLSEVPLPSSLVVFLSGLLLALCQGVRQRVVPTECELS